jgi:Domain of unknown function (DUF929)
MAPGHEVRRFGVLPGDQAISVTGSAGRDDLAPAAAASQGDRRPGRGGMNIPQFLSVIVESGGRRRISATPPKEGQQMAGTRSGSAAGRSPGKPRGPQARQHARERIAAQQAARRRAEARRRLLLAAGSVTAVLAIAATLVAVKLTSTPPRTRASESAAPAAVVRQVTTVPAAALARAGTGPVITPLQAVRRPGPALTIGGKPAVVFISEESCPFCAAERWPLVVALSQFGTWSHLGSTRSSATDVYPGTATLSFRTAAYRSTELTLRTTELANNAGRPLQPQTPLDTRLISTYDVPPYVNSAGQSGAVPFLDIGNHDILAGAQYSPQVLAGLSATQIATQLRNPASPVAKAVNGSAKVIIAAIRQMLHSQAARS